MTNLQPAQLWTDRILSWSFLWHANLHLGSNDFHSSLGFHFSQIGYLSTPHSRSSTRPSPCCQLWLIKDCIRSPLSLLLQQSLWIERTTLILSRPLPGISRWAEVERREVVRSSITHSVSSYTSRYLAVFWSHPDSHVGMKYDTSTYWASSPFIVDLAKRVSWCPGGGEPSGECHLCGGE